jgi:hypothetical protein
MRRGGLANDAPAKNIGAPKKSARETSGFAGIAAAMGTLARTQTGNGEEPPHAPLFAHLDAEGGGAIEAAG